MSIKTVVFDFGQVMVRFEPSYMVGQYVTDVADARLLETVIFDRLYWDRLDAGTITSEETLAECRKRLPERLWEVADKIFYNWIYHIPEIEGMSDLTVELKQRGVKLLLLSNISHYFADHKDEIPSLRVFDDCIFSARVGLVKPSREIFDYLCRTHGIRPEETVFIDDNAANIQGATAFGIHGYLFDGNVPALRAYLDRVLS